MKSSFTPLTKALLIQTSRFQSFEGNRKDFRSLLFTVLLCGCFLVSNAQVALHFAGDDDWVKGTNPNLPQGNAPRTIETWIKYSTGNDKSLFNYGTFASNQKFTLHLYNGVYIIGEGNDTYVNYPVNDGTWHHVAVTHDGTITRVYVDGVERGNQNRNYNTTGTDFQLGISLRNGSNDFRYNGTMDNVRVWNVARTQQQLIENMFVSIATAPNLVASFDFEEGIPNGNNTGITAVVDGTGTANGTPSNFAFTGTSSNYVDGNLAVFGPNAGGDSQVIASGGSSNSSFFLCRTPGSPKDCGYNGSGNLGIGSNVSHNMLVSVSGLSGITAMAGGYEHSLFLKNDGTVWASGRNGEGQLGNGTNTNSNTPVQITSLSGITAIAAGQNHSLFLKDDGSVWACGKNYYGQLGDVSNTDRNTPVQVSGLSGIIAIAAGKDHSLFLKNDGTVRSCGYGNDGGLGNGTNSSSNTSVAVSVLTGITAIAAGEYHSLFLKNDGSVWACGNNGNGRLGDGTTSDRNTAVQASALSSITAIAGGGSHSIFLKNNGSVWTCGLNAKGQLGDGTNTSHSTPASVSALSQITAIVAGYEHSIFLKNDDSILVCGRNSEGQLGDGTNTDRNTPVTVSLSCPPVWIGNTDTDWNTADNWSTDAVPTATDDVVIPSDPSNQPHVTLESPTPATCAGLTVESGATLTIDAGKALSVSGNTDNAGTILIKADASGIGSFIDNGTIAGAGAFQMEQYLTGAGDGTPNGVFYYVSSPTSGATSNVYNAAGTDKLWSADETAQSYSEITNNSTDLNVTEGYVARLGATGTMTFTGGTFNTGNQSAAGLTRTGNTELNRGYNLVGNPYPSSIDWDATVKTNVGATIWYRTHTAIGGMTYDTYNESGPGVGTHNNFTGNDVKGIIAPGQAFWVRVIADETSNGSVSFTNAMRRHGALASIYKQEAVEGMVRFNLSNGTVSDETILHFNTEALDDFDAYDSEKMWASNIPQLYTTIGADSLTINGLYSTATNPIVDLGVKLPSSGNYTLNANEITVVGETVHLEDRLLNIFQDLNVEPNYAFTSVSGNIGDRFALHFGMTAVGIGRDAINRVSTRVYTSNGNTLNIILSENTENGKMDVMDMAGRTVGSFNLNSTTTSLPMNVNAGVYLVRIQTEKGTDTHRIVMN